MPQASRLAPMRRVMSLSRGLKPVKSLCWLPVRGTKGLEDAFRQQ